MGEEEKRGEEEEEGANCASNRGRGPPASSPVGGTCRSWIPGHPGICESTAEVVDIGLGVWSCNGQAPWIIWIVSQKEACGRLGESAGQSSDFFSVSSVFCSRPVLALLLRQAVRQPDPPSICSKASRCWTHVCQVQQPHPITRQSSQPHNVNSRQSSNPAMQSSLPLWLSCIRFLRCLEILR